MKIPVLGSAGPRTIAIDDGGDLAAADIFLCLPGILETSAAFATLATLLDKGHRVVAINFAGRGDSDYLAPPADYRMGTCVADIVATIAWLRGALLAGPGKPGLSHGRPDQVRMSQALLYLCFFGRPAFSGTSAA